MTAALKPALRYAGTEKAGRIAVDTAGVWDIFSSARGAIARGEGALEVSQRFPDYKAFLAAVAGREPAPVPVMLPVARLARFAFGKNSEALSLTFFDHNRPVTVTNADQPDFFGLIMPLYTQESC